MAAPKGNKFAVGNSGRSKQWETPEELQSDIEKYFDICDNRVIEVYDKISQSVKEIKKPIPYTIEGLCEVLDCDRVTLLNYEKQEGYEEFFSTIKRAKRKIQANKVERALDGENSPAVTIFLLKNNYGYKDKTETDLTTGGKPIDNRPQIIMQDVSGKIQEDDK